MAKASASAGSPMQKMMMMNKAKKTMAPKAKSKMAKKGY